jgi:hypothetical protein
MFRGQLWRSGSQRGQCPRFSLGDPVLVTPFLAIGLAIGSPYQRVPPLRRLVLCFMRNHQRNRAAVEHGCMARGRAPLPSDRALGLSHPACRHSSAIWFSIEVDPGKGKATADLDVSFAGCGHAAGSVVGAMEPGIPGFF